MRELERLLAVQVDVHSIAEGDAAQRRNVLILVFVLTVTARCLRVFVPDGGGDGGGVDVGNEWRRRVQVRQGYDDLVCAARLARVHNAISFLLLLLLLLLMMMLILSVVFLFLSVLVVDVLALGIHVDLFLLLFPHTHHFQHIEVALVVCVLV